MSVTFMHDVASLVDVEAELDAQLERIAQGLALLAETAVTLAKADCPVDTGFLRSTHWAGEPERVGPTVKVRMGAWAHYAAAVHSRHREKAGWFDRAQLQVWATAEDRLRLWMRS